MPRRIYTYEPGRGWDTWNLIVTIGAFIQACSDSGVCVEPDLFLLKGKAAGNDPWDAWTLEWSVSSPPPAYNFASFRWSQPPPAVGPEASGRSGQPYE